APGVSPLIVYISTSLQSNNPQTLWREPRSFASRQWTPCLLHFPVDRPPLRGYCSTCRQRANQPSSQSGNARCCTVSNSRTLQLSQSQSLEFPSSPSLIV